MANEQPQHSCPLCGSMQSTELEQVAWSTLWSEISRLIGRAVPASLQDSYPSGSVVRLGCNSCGLEYCTPACPGTPSFYELLSSSETYYDDERWDFDVAREYLPPASRVLDLSCGSGRFLASLGGDVHGIGIDVNPHGVEQARAAGVDATCIDPQTFAAGAPELFDVVCAFQTVEHLQDVRSLITAAAACTRPGGVVVISAPNRERAAINEAAVLDWPPHHLTRWGPQQLSQLVDLAPLELVEVRADRRDPLSTGKAAAYLLATRLMGHDKIASLPGVSRPRLRLETLRARHTMVAVFRRTAA